MAKLFISYAHADSEIVLNIAGQLQEAGYEVWIDKFGIQGGDLWVSEIARGIMDCEVLLLFMSSKSMASDFVRREVQIAFDEKKKILPVRLEGVEIPIPLEYPLAGIQYIDYQTPDWKTRLLRALAGRDVTKPSTTGRLRLYSPLPVLEPIERNLVLSNRKTQLEEAANYLKQHRLLVITGMPGIGKSTFARALLESTHPGSPSAFWYNFERQKSSGNSLSVLLERISGYLDICLNMDVQRDVMAFRNPMGGAASVNDIDVLISFLNQDVPIWLVFDNLETVLSRDTNGFLDENLELLFDSLKNTTHNAKIIITNPFIPLSKTGEPFLEAGTRPIALDGLDNDASIAFLRAYGLEKLPEAKLMPLLREINGHPFVLNHIAHYLKAMDEPDAPELLLSGLEEVSEHFGDSLKQRLTPQEFKALQCLTILNREIRLPGLCQIAQAKPSVVMHLSDKGLLQKNGTGHFWLHNIVRNSLKPIEPELLQQAHLQAVSFYRAQEMPESPQSIDDYANILEWHYHAVQATDVISSYLAIYSTGLQDQLMKWNEYDLSVRLCEQTRTVAYQIEADQSQVAANLSNSEQIKIYHSLGVAYFLLGDYKTSIARLEAALKMLEMQDDKEIRIKLLIDLAESHNSAADFKSAMELCQQLDRLLSNTNYEALRAKFLHLRGIINRDANKFEQSECDLQDALKLYEKLRDWTHFANALLDLGIVYFSENEFSEAITTFERVIPLSQSVEDLRGVMIAHYNLGDISLQSERYDTAVKELQTAFNIAEKKKLLWVEVWAGLNLVDAYIGLQEFDSAQQLLNNLSPLVSKHSSSCLMGYELSLTAMLYWKRLQTDLADKYFTRAFHQFENIDCEEHKARACLAFARFKKDQGFLTEAKDILMLGKSIFTKLNNQLGLDAIERVMLDIQNDDRVA